MSGELHLRPTTDADLDFVLAAEDDRDAAPYIGAWSPDEHRLAIADPNQAHMLVLRGDPVGFVLLNGLVTTHPTIELRRIVVRPAGQGIGRQALRLVLEHVFDVIGAHRVWLDVMVHNERARRAYVAAGFTEEAILRDALETDRGYVSLRVMSVIRSAWEPRSV